MTMRRFPSTSSTVHCLDCMELIVAYNFHYDEIGTVIRIFFIYNIYNLYNCIVQWTGRNYKYHDTLHLSAVLDRIYVQLEAVILASNLKAVVLVAIYLATWLDPYAGCLAYGWKLTVVARMLTLKFCLFRPVSESLVAQSSVKSMFVLLDLSPPPPPTFPATSLPPLANRFPFSS
jgi:hypothetical protein